MFLRTASAITARDIRRSGRGYAFQDEHASLASGRKNQHTSLRSYFDIFISFLFFEITMNPANEIVQINENAIEITPGFLESSEEHMCMKPFRDHPKGLEAYEER